jgi:hypothetical protein
MITQFWDSSFGAVTLKPVVTGAGTENNPLSIATTANQIILIPTNAKVLVLLSPTGVDSEVAKANNLNIKFSYVGAPSVYVDPGFNVNLHSMGSYEIPLEGVARVRITNNNASTVSLPYVIYEVVPQNV